MRGLCLWQSMQLKPRWHREIEATNATASPHWNLNTSFTPQPYFQPVSHNLKELYFKIWPLTFVHLPLLLVILWKPSWNEWEVDWPVRRLSIWLPACLACDDVISLCVVFFHASCSFRAHKKQYCYLHSKAENVQAKYFLVQTQILNDAKMDHSGRDIKVFPNFIKPFETFSILNPVIIKFYPSFSWKIQSWSGKFN